MLKLEIKPFYLNDLLLNLSKEIEVFSKETNITVVMSIDEKTPRWLIGDGPQFCRILVTVVKDALIHTKSDKIFLSLTHEEILHSNNVRICITVKEITLEIADEKSHYFHKNTSQPSNSMKSNFRSIDLDLINSKQLIKMMDGEVIQDNQVGKFSTFEFTVIFKTTCDELNTPSKFLEQNIDQFSENFIGRKILLVEDNEMNREFAIELLKELGLIVKIAVNGREAVKMVSIEDFDLVLMDIQMPEMDGLTATKLIRSNNRFINLPIIAFTANTIIGDKQNCLAVGMNDFLSKPIDSTKLKTVLSYWLSKQIKQMPIGKIELVATNKIVTLDGLPEFLPPFDIPVALSRIRNNRKLMHKLFIMFRKEFTDTVPKLKKLMLEENYQAAKILSHTLHGVARTLEASDLANAAGAIEFALKNDEKTPISNLIETLDQTLKIAIQAAETIKENQ